MQMNSRTRLETALNHRQPDRVPVDFGATAVTGLHVSVVHHLRQRLLGDKAYRVKVIEPYQMLGEVDDELRAALGIDLIGVMPRCSLLGTEQKDWKPWLARLDGDPKLYLPNAYAVEFLRHNLAPERLRWFGDELERQGMHAADHARVAQQRGAVPFRFSAYEEKILWGDLADVFHLVYNFSLPDDPIRQTLSAHHFDAIYLGDRKMGFISEDFRSLMLEVFKVKYLQMPRFREVISSIPMEIRIEHYLNGGDSPDIPIPIYVGYLNQIREMARK